MSNYHFDKESLLELAKGIDNKGFKTTIKCNIGEDGFVESGSLDLLTKPGIYKLQVCLLSDEIKQEIQNGNKDFTGDVFGYCYVNVLAENKITIYGQLTVIISENLSKLKAHLINLGMSDEDFSLYIKALPKLLYTRTMIYYGDSYTFSDWKEKTEEVEISINLLAFSDFTTGDEAAIEEAKKNIFIVPTDLNPGVYIAKVDVTPFIYNIIPNYYTASIDSSGLSFSGSPQYEECEEVYMGENCEDVDTGEVDSEGNPIYSNICTPIYETQCTTKNDGYYQLTVEDVTLGGTPINEWRGTEVDGLFNIPMNANLCITGYKFNGEICEPKTFIESVEYPAAFYEGSNTIHTNYGDITVTFVSDGTKPSLELYTQTYGKLYLRWQLTVDENKIPESIIYNQTLDFTTSFNPAVAFAYCSLQDILLETLSGSGKILRTIENGVDGGWKSIDRIGVNILKLIKAEPPISIEYNLNNGLEISHVTKDTRQTNLSKTSNGNFQAITAVDVDSLGHVDNITTTNYSVNPATSTQNGLMSSADKTYIESIKPVLTVESDKLSINKDTKITGDTELVGTFRQGSGTVATGLYSHAEGYYTIANNTGEHSEGIFNVSNTGQGTDKQTIHSVGIGTSNSDRKNAVEIMQNGDYYMLGVGGYQGTNTKTQDATVKTVREVINGKQDILKAGTNISIENGEVSATGYKFNTELYSFAELLDILMSHYMDMTSALPPASITFTGAAGSTTYNVGGEYAALLSNYVGMAAFKIGDGPIALLTSYDPASNTATFDKSLDENNDLSDTPFSKAYRYIQITFSGDANATTYSFTDMTGSAGDVIVEGGKIKIGNYPIATIVSVNVENSTITLDKTLDPDNAVSNAMFDYIILPNNTASGRYSHAEGFKTTASGYASHIEGSNNISGGTASHAEGENTTASGDYSHAEGQSTTASDKYSHAEGYGGTASGYASHAEGYSNIASGSYSHAEGKSCTASGYASHSEGQSTTASGYYSHAEGNNTTASGDCSHAEGQSTTASGKYSHAEGYGGTASGYYSHVEGAGNTTSLDFSHAEGNYTNTLNQAEHSEGKYNISIQNKTIHTVGIGNSENTRKNAHEIHIDGKHYVYGIGGYNGTNSQTAGVKTLQEVVNSKQDKLTTEISWSDLKSKRDNGALIPGMQYRITDYVTTTIQANTQSAGHPFDVIVTALDTNKLSEIASAIQSTRDTNGYFSNSNLVAWQLWYCLDNDTNRFSWADSTNGKGVIYRMIDEFNNDCPYDFKNIQFKRYAVTNVTSTKLTSDILNNLKNILVKDSNGGLYFATKNSYGNFVPSNVGGASYEINENDSNWYYTFQGISSADGSTISKMYDLTVETFKLTDECISFLENNNSGADTEDYCRENKIEQFNQEYFLDDIYYKGRQILNNIVFISGLNYCYYNEGNSYWEYNTSLIYGNRFGVNCNSNTFGNGCYNNIFGNECNSSTFGNYFNSNTFGGYCRNNTFGNGCSSNTFGDGCSSNIFEGYCHDNTFESNCYGNTFGNSCYNNIFGNEFNRNTFGNNCSSNTFGNYFNSNTFGDFCRNNTFGNGCSSNTFGNYIQESQFGDNVWGFSITTQQMTTNPTSSYLKNYIRWLIVENGVRYVNAYVTGSTSINSQCQNVRICLGIQGVDSDNRKTFDITSCINSKLNNVYQPENSQTTSV